MDKQKIPIPNKEKEFNIEDLHELAGNASSAIFFLECREEKESFGLLSECAFESAATRNPNVSVIVVANESSQIDQFSPYLATIKNLHFAKIDFKKLTDDTVFEVSIFNIFFLKKWNNMISWLITFVSLYVKTLLSYLVTILL